MADPIPKGYRTVTPYLAVDNADAAIEFYGRAFGAEVHERMEAPNGSVAHAAVRIGDSLVMLSDPFPMSNAKPPKEIGGTSVVIFLYMEDVDAAFQRAVDAGATATVPPEDMFWGDRFAQVGDPFGHFWQIATHVEDVSEEEIAERAKRAMAEMGMG